MAASMWEVTRLVLGDPDDAAGIAQAHGFTFAQVTDLLPLFLDNVTTGYDEAADLPAGAPDGPGDDAVARWLDGWARQVGDGAVDVVSYDGFGTPELDADPFDAGWDVPQAPHVEVPDADPAHVVSFGVGGTDGAGGVGEEAHALPDLVADDAHDHGATGGVDFDDPFDLGEHPDTGLPPGIDAELSGEHHDPGAHPDHTTDGDASFH